MADCAGKALDPTVHLVTDGLVSPGAAAEVVAARGSMILTPYRLGDVDPFHCVNTIIPNLKMAIGGTYDHFRLRRYPRRYLAEAQYRVNRRFDLRSLGGRLMYTCANTAPCPSIWLLPGVARAG